MNVLAELTPVGDTTTVRFVRDYATTPEDLWDAVSTPERVSRWFARVEGEFAVGQPFTLHFDDGTADFEVATCAPPTAASVRWLKGDASTLVTIEVTALDDRTSRLVLVHEGIPSAQAPGYSTGWHWHLSTLGLDYGDSPDRPEWDEIAAAYQELVSA